VLLYRVDAAEAAIAKLTRKAEAAIVAAAHRTAAATEKKLEGRGKAGKGIREAIKDSDDAAAVVSTAQFARPSQRRQSRDALDHARDAPVHHALPERRHGEHSLSRHRGVYPPPHITHMYPPPHMTHMANTRYRGTEASQILKL
jgi:hypothetical protein